MSQTHTSTDIVGQLYRSHHAWLHGWLRKKLGCVHSSADVAQDVFVRVLASRDRLCGIREPRAYLTTTAQHLLVDRMRREVLEKTYLAELAVTMESMPSHPSPEQILLTLEALQQIAEVLDGVSDKARQAFLMHYLEGMPQTDIAEQLGVTPRMIHKYLAQCLMRCAGLGPS